jgi:hypothetical protein
MDGFEEEQSSGSPPFLLFRAPPVGELVRAVETARRGEEPPDFGAMYELSEVDRTTGVALYISRA